MLLFALLPSFLVTQQPQPPPEHQQPLVIGLIGGYRSIAMAAELLGLYNAACDMFIRPPR
jgi:hypothetical protein